MMIRFDFSTMLLCIKADVMSTIPIESDRVTAIERIIRGDTRCTVGEEYISGASAMSMSPRAQSLALNCRVDFRLMTIVL